MAKRETNEVKRAQMAAIMESLLLTKGYTATEIAVLLGVTPSAVSQWKLGKSMGTNAQRAFLASLPAHDTDEAKAAIAKVVKNAEVSLEVAQVRLTEESSTPRYDEHLADARSNREFQIEYHTNKVAEAEARKAAATQPGGNAWDIEYITKEQPLGQDNELLSRYEWDVQYHTQQAQDARDTTQEDIANEAANRQAQRVAWAQKDLKKAQKTLANAKKAQGNW